MSKSAPTEAPLCYSIKACKPILVATQSNNMDLKNTHNMSPLHYNRFFFHCSSKTSRTNNNMTNIG